ncbi:motile sperm domain-containing protein 2-like [Limulus polyphemus]|uniref:Motile sperm domain-containing protein 2-like n=1 Tax=Limulus polyphemus TaxID=6850 RepID=A0ABM1BZF0_LIMPO|nr:motile sperm domain-containing protein 2-like [Limulus polyphemus]
MGHIKTRFVKEVENLSGSADVEKLRQRFLKYLEEEDWTGLYDPRDVQRLKNDDYYCKRILRHQSGNVNSAVESVKNIFKWRQEMGINDLTEDDIDPEIVKIGAVFSYNKDREGSPLLILRVNCHRKDPDTRDERRKIVAYWVEKMERERKGESVSVLMDCSSSGMANMDVDFTMYLMSLFITYYPAFIDHIYVFEMPWIMNACWKIIKKMISSSTAERIKFLTKTSFTEYLNPEELPPHLGGTCLKKYRPSNHLTCTGEEEHLNGVTI